MSISNTSRFRYRILWQLRKITTITGLRQVLHSMAGACGSQASTSCRRRSCWSVACWIRFAAKQANRMVTRSIRMRARSFHLGSQLGQKEARILRPAVVTHPDKTNTNRHTSHGLNRPFSNNSNMLLRVSSLVKQNL